MAEATDKAEEVGGTTWARGRCRSERCVLGLMIFFFAGGDTTIKKKHNCDHEYHFHFWYKLTVPQ